MPFRDAVKKESLCSLTKRVCIINLPPLANNTLTAVVIHDISIPKNYLRTFIEGIFLCLFSETFQGLELICSVSQTFKSFKDLWKPCQPKPHPTQPHSIQHHPTPQLRTPP